MINARTKRILQELGNGDSSESIHDARKEIKKIRATLRLIRDGLGRKDCRKLNMRFKEAGRALSPVREAAVLVSTTKKIPAANGSSRAKAILSKLRDHLKRRTADAAQRRALSADCLALVRCAEIGKVPWRRVHWSHLRSGLMRSCRRSRKAFETAKTKPSPENFHEWRKRAKDLLYQLRLLEPVVPLATSRLIKRLKQVTDDLGDIHDLVMLSRAVGTAELGMAEKDVIEKIIAARFDKLRRLVFALGKKSHSREARRLVKKVSRSCLA